ncbi:MAG: hypothetical protein AB4042_10750 [Leptolyngbyaceae cyanobacterium]
MVRWRSLSLGKSPLGTRVLGVGAIALLLQRLHASKIQNLKPKMERWRSLSLGKSPSGTRVLGVGAIALSQIRRSPPS